MATIVNASIDLAKINKSKIKIGNNGQKWLSISIVLNDEPDNYGYTVQISENQTAEERTAKDKKNYLGNGKVAWTGESKSTPKQETKPTPKDDTDDIPF